MPIELRFGLHQDGRDCLRVLTRDFHAILSPVSRSAGVAGIESECRPTALHKRWKALEILMSSISASNHGRIERRGLVALVAHQSAVSAEPHCTIGRLLDRIDSMAGQAVAVIEQRPRGSVKARRAVVRADPKQT